MLLYRFTRSKYAADLSGYGAARHGGRWNKKGTAVLYCSETPELALLETLVHLPSTYVRDMVLITLKVKSDSAEVMNIEDLPADWNSFPAPSRLANFGTDWFNRKSSLMLNVPSSIIPMSRNVLVNVGHPEFKKVAIRDIRPFELDQRLKS